MIPGVGPDLRQTGAEVDVLNFLPRADAASADAQRPLRLHPFRKRREPAVLRALGTPPESKRQVI